MLADQVGKVFTFRTASEQSETRYIENRIVRRQSIGGHLWFLHWFAAESVLKGITAYRVAAKAFLKSAQVFGIRVCGATYKQRLQDWLTAKTSTILEV